MNGPYTICHILSALDGKITGEFMRMESTRSVSGEYGRIRTEYHAGRMALWNCNDKGIYWMRKPAGIYSKEVIR